MSRYSRVPATIDGDRDNDVPSPDVGESRIQTEGTKPRHQGLKRRGSLSTSQSSEPYISIDNNEEIFLKKQNEENDSDKDRSPLPNGRSYASDDNIDEDHDLTGNGTTVPSRSASPVGIYPAITTFYSDSFDLDDDEDDDVLEANLRRYNLDFSSTDKGASTTDGIVNGENLIDRGTVNSNRCSRIARYLWFSFQSVRQQARQRRAQLLLQQTERNWRQSLKICVLTNCDATDSGILLVAAIMLLWILTLVLAKDRAVRKIGIILGVVFFIVRVGTRPLYHFLLRQRQKRQLQHQRLEEIPQNSPTQEFRHIEDQYHHHLAHSAGTLELNAIQGDGNNTNRLSAASAGLDPTVAAI